MRDRIYRFLASCLLAALAIPAQAQVAGPREAERFQVGNGGAVCEAQGVRLGAARETLFDRKWALICKDVDRPIGAAYSWRSPGEVADRVARDRATPLDCGEAGYEPGTPAGTLLRHCRDDTGLEWNSYRIATGGWVHVVEGLSAFDSALRLALASLAEDRVVPGTVDIVTTGGTGSFAQARASLGDTELLIGQGYRQNNAGDYADAEEYFRTDLIAAAELKGGENGAALAARNHEVLVNRALQLSNLGRHAEAAKLFDEARAMNLRDPIQSRLLRNFEAIDALNQRDTGLARQILARPMPGLTDALDTAGGAVAIDQATAASLNSGLAEGLTDSVSQETRLTNVERATIIDAQADQLGATADRLDGKPQAAMAKLEASLGKIRSIREGRVLSVARLEAQLMSEMALAHEALGENQQAEMLLRDALALVQARYPEGASVGAAKARLAAYLTRHGEEDGALSLYREVVGRAVTDQEGVVGLQNQLAPYFDILARDSASKPEYVADLFMAAQMLERPGAARTLSQLSRRLAAGNSAASDLFRRETAVRRELNRIDIEAAQYQAAGGTPAPAGAMEELEARRARLQQAQVELVNSLSAFPAYRSVAHSYLSLADLQGTLRPGEAYLKLVQNGNALYAVFATPTTASGWKVAASSNQVRDLVHQLRDSISVTMGGITATYPFDVDASRSLFEDIFGPVAGQLGGIRHLVFEPDGALMELPINLLVTDQASVDAYHRRVAAGGDEYDFRGVGWLGRNRAISTALSPASFRDARQAPASRAGELYLGMGQNAPVGQATRASLTKVADPTIDPGCEIPLAAWNRPISAGELLFASSELGSQRSNLLLGADFTDTAIEHRADLDNYRIVHFATHGIVTAPRASCPARPALLTSFGGAGSDGLLQFGDIFDLNLDADLVILSACNTASLAGLTTTRAAGLEEGGDQALDGLVRAFIGAGGRQVIASHWPAPEEYDATRRLFDSFFSSPPSTGIGEALMAAEQKLMDDPETSHPFYWSGFAIIGDGERPLFHND